MNGAADPMAYSCGVLFVCLRLGGFPGLRVIDHDLDGTDEDSSQTAHRASPRRHMHMQRRRYMSVFVHKQHEAT